MPDPQVHLLGTAGGGAGVCSTKSGCGTGTFTLATNTCWSNKEVNCPTETIHGIDHGAIPRRDLRAN